MPSGGPTNDTALRLAGGGSSVRPAPGGSVTFRVEWPRFTVSVYSARYIGTVIMARSSGLFAGSPSCLIIQSPGRKPDSHARVSRQTSCTSSPLSAPKYDLASGDG